MTDHRFRWTRYPYRSDYEDVEWLAEVVRGIINSQDISDIREIEDEYLVILHIAEEVAGEYRTNLREHSPLDIPD